jgi:hypothetical protein
VGDGGHFLLDGFLIKWVKIDSLVSLSIHGHSLGSSGDA